MLISFGSPCSPPHTSHWIHVPRCTARQHSTALFRGLQVIRRSLCWWDVVTPEMQPQLARGVSILVVITHHRRTTFTRKPRRRVHTHTHTRGRGPYTTVNSYSYTVNRIQSVNWQLTSASRRLLYVYIIRRIALRSQLYRVIAASTVEYIRVRNRGIGELRLVQRVPHNSSFFQENLPVQGATS